MAARGGSGCSHPGCGQLIGVSEAAGAGLMRCTRCRQRTYCSKACQKAGWKGGHKQECKRLREGGEGGGGSGGAALQEALLAALLGGIGRALTDRQKRLYEKMLEAFNAEKYAEVVEMAGEGQAVAEELWGAWPGLAARIYWMLGDSRVEQCEHVKGMGLLEQARALAVESGDRAVMGQVCYSLGSYHRAQGEYTKAMEEFEQGRAIAVEVSDRQGEGAVCSNLGGCYRALKEYDKAIELFEHSLAITEELGDKMGQARTRWNLGVCMSRHGQHDKAVAYLKQAWAVYQELGDEEARTRAAKILGQALWARARAEHHQAAPDATSCGGVSAASADTLQEAETWLRTALDLAGIDGYHNFRMDAQMHLAYVVMMKGDEDEAVELLSQHLTGWVADFGSQRCAGCGQVRGEDAPMLSCNGCRVVRCVYAATPVLFCRDWHACRVVADREAWMDDAGTAMRITSGWRGRARLKDAATAFRTRASARC